MSNGGLDDTMQSLRRIVTTGAITAALVLVGALVLFAASLLFQVARFAPFGGWGVLLVLVVAAAAAVLVWLRGSISIMPRRTRPMLSTDVIYRMPPPAPVRAPRAAAVPAASGRLGAEALINRLVAERRYDDALGQLAQLEAADPGMAGYCAVKRRTIARRQTRRP